MQPFSKLTAVAAPIDLANIDTDRIIPARFLRKLKGVPGYASFLFRDVRFDADGSEKPEFVLNRMPYRGAKILVVAENFGCGSSREMAVWVLEAYGIRSVIAPSLGDIFHQNCFKNGLLPVILSAGRGADGADGGGARRDAPPLRHRPVPQGDAAHRPGRDRPDTRVRSAGSRVRGAPRPRDGLGDASEALGPEGRGRCLCSTWRRRRTFCSTSGATWAPRTGSRSIRR